MCAIRDSVWRRSVTSSWVLIRYCGSPESSSTVMRRVRNSRRPSLVEIGCSSVSRPRFLIAASSRAMISLASLGLKISAIADAFDDQRHRNVVDHQFQELLGILEFTRQRAAFGNVVEQRDQELGFAAFIARDHPIGGENPLLRSSFDREFGAMITLRCVQRGLVRGVDTFRGFGPEDLVGTLADDMIAGE